MTAERDQTEKFQALVRDIANILEWKYDEPSNENADRWAGISRSDGAAINFYHYKGRIRMSGKFPRGYEPWHGDKPAPHCIHVSDSKDAHAIVKAMQSRLLGDYLQAVAEAFKRKELADAQQAVAEELAQRLGEIIGAVWSEGRKSRLLHYSQPPADMWAEIEVSPGDGGVKIELRHLTAEQAERVLRVIGEGEGNA
jgi:hypothetical protein